MVDVGQAALDFTVMDHNQQQVTLSQFKGKKNVILSCHVFSFTSG
ncbi:MAG: redoxin domain-containing protein [SAR202 cluster bacterium]|nr:redoxin domain-containing protein [SAR202 cluster bacterium]